MSGGGFWRRTMEYLGLAHSEEQRQASPHVLQRRIEHLEQQVEALARLSGIDPRRLPQPQRPNQEVLDLLRSGKKIQAVKRYRELTGAGLREAKEAVDELEARGGGGPRHL